MTERECEKDMGGGADWVSSGPSEAREGACVSWVPATVWGEREREGERPTGIPGAQTKRENVCMSTGCHRLS